MKIHLQTRSDFVCWISMLSLLEYYASLACSKFSHKLHWKYSWKKCFRRSLSVWKLLFITALEQIWSDFFPDLQEEWCFAQKLVPYFEFANHLKYRSEEKSSSFCKCSILLGFIMSKKLKGLWFYLLLQSTLVFFT